MSVGDATRPSLEPHRTVNGASSLIAVPSGTDHYTCRFDFPGGTAISAASNFTRSAALPMMAPPPGAEEAALAVVMTGGEIVTALSFLSHATSNRMINEKRFKDSPRRTWRARACAPVRRRGRAR